MTEYTEIYFCLYVTNFVMYRFHMLNIAMKITLF